MRITVLAGGVGGARFALGLRDAALVEQRAEVGRDDRGQAAEHRDGLVVDLDLAAVDAAQGRDHAPVGVAHRHPDVRRDAEPLPDPLHVGDEGRGRVRRPQGRVRGRRGVRGRAPGHPLVEQHDPVALGGEDPALRG